MQHVTSTENIQGYVLWPIVDAGWCELALSLRTTARSLPLHTTRSRVSPRAGAGAHWGCSSGPSASPARSAIMWYVLRLTGLDRPLRLWFAALGSVCYFLKAWQPRLLLLLPARQALCTSDTAAACYCGCLEQLEPETIELLAAMTEAAVNVTLLLRLDCSAPSAVSALLCALSSEIIHGLNCQELPRTT